MIAGSALSARAIADAARRALASEWGGPETDIVRSRIAMAQERARRVTIRKP